MGITRIGGLLAVVVAALVLVGCATKPPVIEDPIEPKDSGVVTIPADVVEEVKPAEAKVIGEKLVVPVAGDPGATEELTGVFYFDFDQAIVKRVGHTELDKHAGFLTGNRSSRVRLEGHADERGTREYNLALGERRTNAIRAYLVAQGVSRSQIEVVSYGEEKPVALGSNESAWRKNRRVEFKHRK